MITSAIDDPFSTVLPTPSTSCSHATSDCLAAVPASPKSTTLPEVPEAEVLYSVGRGVHVSEIRRPTKKAFAKKEIGSR